MPEKFIGKARKTSTKRIWIPRSAIPPRNTDESVVGATCNAAPRMPDHTSAAEEVNADPVNADFRETNLRHTGWGRHARNPPPWRMKDAQPEDTAENVVEDHTGDFDWGEVGEEYFTEIDGGVESSMYKSLLPRSAIPSLNLDEYFVGASAAGSESAHDVASAMRHCDRCDEVIGELGKNAQCNHYYLGVDLHTAAEKPTCNDAPMVPDHISDAEEVNAGRVNAYLRQTNWRHTRWGRHEGDGGVESLSLIHI